MSTLDGKVIVLSKNGGEPTPVAIIFCDDVLEATEEYIAEYSQEQCCKLSIVDRQALNDIFIPPEEIDITESYFESNDGYSELFAVIFNQGFRTHLADTFSYFAEESRLFVTNQLLGKTELNEYGLITQH